MTEAIRRLRSRGYPVNFANVARTAGLGRATLYRRDDLRTLVAAARDRLPCTRWRTP